MTITGFNHITLSVSDLDRSFDFYSRVLEFKPAAKWKNGVYLEAGNIWLALLVDDRVRKAERPDYSHVAFSCSAANFENLCNRLETEGYAPWQDNISEGSSYYFCDPDRHKLELHVGDLSTRLESMKEKPWAEFTFFD